jgi:molecular chaperone DnaK (HSP70)
VRIGIDFGTTRIVVAVADRGNYPLVTFEARDGRVRDWFPSLLAVSEDKRAYGWEALERQAKPGWTIVRSLKRCLKNAGPSSALDIAGRRLSLSLLMTEMMAALRRELLDKSRWAPANTTGSKRCSVSLRTPTVTSDFSRKRQPGRQASKCLGC